MCLFVFKKTLLTEIKKVLPVVKFASGHGFDFLTVANQALEHELEAPDHFPGAILAVLSLDAKFVFKQHYTQTSLRFDLESEKEQENIIITHPHKQKQKHNRLVKDPNEKVKNLSCRQLWTLAFLEGNDNHDLIEANLLASSTNSSSWKPRRRPSYLSCPVT